jgi:alkylation response protein AidB-like acyl-CoA dehydrogenase
MYRAPLKEIRFALHQLIGDGQLAGKPGFEDYSLEYADSVLDEAAQFAEKVIAPVNVIGDRTGATWTADGVVMPPEFKAAYAKFVEAGWGTLGGPPEHGGQGAPALLTTAVEEMWTSASLAFKLCPLLTRGAVEAINHSGSEQMKARFLPKMVTGEWTGTMNLTEPQAGSDLGLIRTRAAADGEHHRIFGEKIFITYGDHDYTENVVHLVLARIDGAPAGVRGISLFIVPKYLVDANGAIGERNDVRCSSIEHKLGIRGSPTCVMTYGSGPGAVGYLVGEANRGLEYMFVMMNAARLGVALEGYSVAERAYQLAAEWARTRVQGRPAGSTATGPAPINGHSDVKRMLLTMRSTIAAARAITMYTALQLDLAHHEPDAAARAVAQARADLLIPIAKGWATETGNTLASLGIQVHGGMGFVEETGAAQHLRDVRITTIYEGTTGIQAIDLVGRKVSRDNGAAMLALVADMRSELGRLQAGASRAVATQALEGVDLLEAATGAVLKAGERGAQYLQAIAVPFLHLAGVVIGGWMMAKSHELASKPASEDAEFAAAKRRECEFYGANVLPQALGLSRIVTSGGETVVDAAIA